MFLHYFVNSSHLQTTQIVQKLQQNVKTVKLKMLNVSHTVNRLWTSSQNSLKMSSFNCIQAHTCMCAQFHTQSLQHCLVSETGNTEVHITRSISPDINRVDYSICSIAK